MTHVLHEIKDINQKLDSITFSDDNESNYMLIVKLEDGTRYTYSLIRRKLCCETIGFFMPKTQFVDEALRVTKTVSKTRVITRSNELTGHVLNKLVINVNDLDEDMMYNEGRMATMELIFANGEIFEFGYYNKHNGFYPHHLYLKLYEKLDVDGMLVFKSTI